ncbi:MAG: hypothetical protein ABSB29_02050 [Nitrososphaerales archaeon]
MILAYAGLIQFVISGYLVAFTIVAIPFAPLMVSFLVAVISIAIFIALRRYEPPIGTLEVSYVDRRDTGGTLQLSYTNSRGERRTHVAVVEVKAFPTKPLYKKSGQTYLPLEGTSASMMVRFENMKRLDLLLGFPTVDEMLKVYSHLKDSGTSDLNPAHR